MLGTGTVFFLGGGGGKAIPWLLLCLVIFSGFWDFYGDHFQEMFVYRKDSYLLQSSFPKKSLIL